MAGTHNEPQSANEALLQNILGENNDIRIPQSRIEELLLELLNSDIGDVDYTTEAPTEANTNGKLKFVVLPAAPANKYDGYVYIITEA